MMKEVKTDKKKTESEKDSSKSALKKEAEKKVVFDGGESKRKSVDRKKIVQNKKNERMLAASKKRKPTDKLSDKTAMTRFLMGVFGDAQKAILKRLYKKVIAINALAEKYEGMTDKELKERMGKLRAKYEKTVAAGLKSIEGKKKLTKKEKKASLKASIIASKKGVKGSEADSGEKKEDVLDILKVNDADRQAVVQKALDSVLADVFALVREATDRTLNMRHFDVQLVGGMALHEGNVAEMKTGEGKTLVAILPAALNALTGDGVHVITVNDYLAQRDAGWNGPVYDFLGLKVGVIINHASFVYDKEYTNEEHEDERFRHLRPSTRKEAYAADITYGTNNEFGFDYLRDNMVNDVKNLRQRKLNFAIIDEVDSILIDEARTPLIISAPTVNNPENYYKFAKIMSKLEDEDFIFDEKRRSVVLTDAGIDKIEKMLGISELYDAKNASLIFHVDQALKAEIVFKRDKDYVVTNSGEVVIVDEHTGRLMQGRRYNEGLHQAIEAKEAVSVKEESMTLATISFQNFFRLYSKLSGMTGTAFTEAEEFQQIYALDVIQIPPNKKIIRVDKDDLIYQTSSAKFKAIAESIRKYHKKGRPVLVGSGSIVQNEAIARYLDKEGIKYEILNAKNNEKEAAIIEKAGEKGAITLSTNMAGRGTDIKLGKGVKELGGLVVIGSERHESRRIDNQLRGRSGRQGDPGTTQFFVSTEDDLMRIFQGPRVAMIMKAMRLDEDTPIQAKSISRTLEAAQKRIEGFHFDSRKNVVQYDNVISRHRRVVYMMRRKILDGESIRAEIGRLIKEEVKELTQFSSRVNKKFVEEFKASFDLDEEFIEKLGKMRKEKERYKLALAEVEEKYSTKEEEIGDEIMRKMEREVYMQVLDMLWMQHLEDMQHLREGIQWRQVAQKDPLVEYRSESKILFDALQKNLRQEVLKVLLSLSRRETSEEEVHRTELTDAAGSATIKGVDTVESGEKNMDNEFKGGVRKNDEENKNRAKNLAKRKKKAAKKAKRR